MFSSGWGGFPRILSNMMTAQELLFVLSCPFGGLEPCGSEYEKIKSLAPTTQVPIGFKKTPPAMFSLVTPPRHDVRCTSEYTSDGWRPRRRDFGMRKGDRSGQGKPL